MNSIVKHTDVDIADKFDEREIARARFHDLQNYLHLATMEVELAQLNSAEKIDCPKLLKILNAFKQSLQELRDQLLPSNDSKDQPR
jgi:hypothetical protein